MEGVWLVDVMFFFWVNGRLGMDWILCVEYGIKDRNVMYIWGLGMWLRVEGWLCVLCVLCEVGLVFGIWDGF